MSTTTTRKLNMTFGNDDGNKTIGLDDPLTSLTSETVSETMAEIIALETLTDTKGSLLTQAVGAVLETITKQTLF